MTEPEDVVTLDRMKGAIGSLLFLMSDIERDFSGDARATTEPGPGRAPRPLDSPPVLGPADKAEAPDRPAQAELHRQVVAFIEEARAVRNLVCHALVGASAALGSREAHLLLGHGTARRVFTWSEMQRLLVRLDRSRWTIRALDEAAADPDAAHSEARLQAFLEAETGLGLPIG